MIEQFILSPKYKAFLKHNAPVEFLEGTTAAGKTTVGVVKFMLKAAESEKKLHILSGLDLGTIEKNIINKDLGICDVFGDLVSYNASGKGQNSLPHIFYRTQNGEKIIYVLGYDNKARWKKALGGQYGCLYIDEINIADMEYVREASMRCDYFIATLNPDDPNLPVYSEFINHSRPLKQYEHDAPEEINNMLTEEPKPDWVHWFFSFDDNAGLSPEKKQRIISAVPVGTKLYKNKILGVRGRATGLVFNNFEHNRHIISAAQAKQEKYIQFSAALDTSYSSASSDTIAMSYIGITDSGKCIVLDERVYNNKDLNTPIAPSDTARNFVDFLNRNGETWGYTRNVFIDSADQATITELNKFKRTNGCIYTFNNAWKKMTVIDRINTQLGWFATGDFLILEHCKNYISELDIYSWLEDKDSTPEDGHDHMVNSVQYAWIPYKTKIGVNSI